MEFESIPLIESDGPASSSRNHSSSSSDLMSPAADTRTKVAWPYRQQTSMRYCDLPEQDTGAGITDVRCSNDPPTTGTRVMSVFQLASNQSSIEHHDTHTAQSRDTGRDHTPHQADTADHSDHTHSPNYRDNASLQTHDHAGHDGRRHSASSAPACLASIGRLASNLSSYAIRGHISLSSFMTHCLPPPEDPCAPSACCCWAAVHDLCFSPSEEVDSSHYHSHGDFYHHEHSHDHDHGLKLKKQLDSHDATSCESHCCDKSRYFLSIKATPASGCHGH